MTAVQKVFESNKEAFAEISDHYEGKIEKLQKELCAVKEELETLKDNIFLGKSQLIGIPGKSQLIGISNLAGQKTEFVEISAKFKEEISRSPFQLNFENLNRTEVQLSSRSDFSPKISEEISRSPLQVKFPENKFLQFSFARPPPLFPKN